MTNQPSSSFHEILKKIRPMVNGLSSEQRLALIQAIAAEEPSNTGQDEIAREQESWFERPAQERRQFPGEFVAVKDGKIIDHDKDQRSLTIRTRALNGGTVLIIHSDWNETPVYNFHSPKIDRE
jgi:hypothetical protein